MQMTKPEVILQRPHVLYQFSLKPHYANSLDFNTQHFFIWGCFRETGRNVLKVIVFVLHALLKL